MKDQIDRMKRKKIEDEDDWNIGSDEGGDSLEQPTIKKGGDSGTYTCTYTYTCTFTYACMCTCMCTCTCVCTLYCI